MDNKSLAIALATCEKEDDVIRLLKAEGLWDDPTRWRNFGDNENNWSTIGNHGYRIQLPERIDDE